MVKRTGPGLKAIGINIRELDGLQARTGWFETAKYPSGIPVAAVAQIHEFGAGPIPPRPFMRPTVVREGQKWIDQLGQGAKSVLAGKRTGEQVLEIVALGAAQDIGKSIVAVTQPPLSPLTLRAREHRKAGGTVTGSTLGVLGKMVGPAGFGVSTKPLVDTSQMLQSVTAIVERKG